MFEHLATLAPGTEAFQGQRDAIVERCLPLAANIARRYDRRGEPLEDLIQVARLGLLNAVRRFDIESGSNFVGFAVPTILGEVRRHFRDHGWAVTVPRRFRDMSGPLNQATAELTVQLGRSPNASELATRLGMPRDQVLDGLTAANAYSTKSTDAVTGHDEQGNGRSFGDTLGVIDANLDKVLDIETVRPLLMALPEREQRVIAWRFFDELTQSQIAERLGISQMHVSQILSRTLSLLRSQVSRPDLAGDRARTG